MTYDGCTSRWLPENRSLRRWTQNESRFHERLLIRGREKCVVSSFSCPLETTQLVPSRLPLECRWRHGHPMQWCTGTCLCWTRWSRVNGCWLAFGNWEHTNEFWSLGRRGATCNNDQSTRQRISFCRPTASTSTTTTQLQSALRRFHRRLDIGWAVPCSAIVLPKTEWINGLLLVPSTSTKQRCQTQTSAWSHSCLRPTLPTSWSIGTSWASASWVH